MRLSASALLVSLVAAMGCTSIPPTESSVPTIGRPSASTSLEPIFGDAAVERFAAIVAAESPINVVSDASIAVDDGLHQTHLGLHIAGEVEGGDFAGRRIIDIPEGTIEEEVILVDGVYHMRQFDDDWVIGRASDVDQPLNPFYYQGASPSLVDLAYDGSINRNGVPLYRVVVASWFDGPIALFDFSDGRIATSWFVVYVTEQGLPVTAELNYVLTGQMPEGTTSMAHVVVYQFRDVGVPVTIKVPVNGAPI
jgi:hypothetical protein